MLTRKRLRVVAPHGEKMLTAEKDWYETPLHALIDHILQVHHVCIKEALPRLRGLVRKVLH